MITMVRKAGMAMVKSDQSISRIPLERIRKPTTTRAGVAAWVGTMVASGVRNSATTKNRPVTTEARPVRAPSPTPEVDSTKQVLAELEVAPPSAVAKPSTMSTLLMPGRLPSLSSRCASSLTPRIVPIASKKQDSSTVKTKRMPVSRPTWWKPPNRLTLPIRPKSGVDTMLCGKTGTVRPHSPAGMVAALSRITARMVVAMMLIRIAPGTLRTSRIRVSSAQTMNTSTGQPSRWPLPPSWSGTVVCAASGIRVTKPPSTKPIRAMKRPMPMAMALRRPSGTAFITRSRRPVATSSMIAKPARTTMPIASGQLILGASCSATMLLVPRPAARASGTLPMTPISRVVNAAVITVAVTSCPLFRWWPYLSTPEDRMIGFSTMM